LKLFIGGARGSVPVSGRDFLSYGGNTPCVAVLGSDGPPRLLLDAGTGIRRVMELLGGRAFEGSILLSHLHWDHVQGLPFFWSADRDDAKVRLWTPAQGDPQPLLARMMSPPFFPIDPSGLRGNWTFEQMDEGERDLEGFHVAAREIPHKGGRTFGYRISDATATFAYVSDHCPTSVGPGPDGLGEYHDAILDLVEGVDLLIHDGQYVTEELGDRAGFGHSAIGYAVGLAEKAGCGRLLLFHHDPARTDDDIDELVAKTESSVDLAAASEGEIIDL
jgi:phosphoribosyl 1,2-cyclic phosphodiesterase